MTFSICTLRSGSRRNSRGFSLLEALISIVLLSVGALGVAGLQAVSLKNSKSAEERGRVAQLAQAMVDEARLRSPTTVSESPNIVGASFVNVSCATTTTTPLQAWRRRLDCEIPGALGSVDYDRSQKRLIVRVRWDDSRGLGGSATETFTLDTRL
jgi:type IV pilus assembly protein PilV